MAGSRNGDEDDGLQKDQRDVHVEDEDVACPLLRSYEQVWFYAVLPPQPGGREEGPNGHRRVCLAQVT